MPSMPCSMPTCDGEALGWGGPLAGGDVNVLQPRGGGHTLLARQPSHAVGVAEGGGDLGVGGQAGGQRGGGPAGGEGTGKKGVCGAVR